MMMARILKPKSFVAYESDFASKGKFKKLDKDDRQFCSLRVRYESGNARKAEAIARSVWGNDLELLKTLLVRGHLDECATLIERLQNSTRGDPLFENEVLQQEARFEYLRGEWLNCIRICDLLDQKPDLPMLSRMAMYQIRSNAFFEVSDFDRSLLDHRKIEGMEAQFPKGQLPLYAHTNRVRIQARLLGLPAGKTEEEKLWKHWSLHFSAKNLDPALTLLRSRIDLLRLEGKDFAREALAARAIANAMGDDLYEALALFDFYLTQRGQVSSALEAQMRMACKSHPRVEKLFNAVILGQETLDSESMKGMMAYWSDFSDQGSADLEGQWHTLYLSGLNLKIDLSLLKIEKMTLQERSEELIRAISIHPIKKEDLFCFIWKLKSFSAEKHDSVIRTAVARARQQSGLKIESIDGSIGLQSGILIIYI